MEGARCAGERLVESLGYLVSEVNFGLKANTVSWQEGIVKTLQPAFRSSSSHRTVQSNFYPDMGSPMPSKICQGSNRWWHWLILFAGLMFCLAASPAGCGISWRRQSHRIPEFIGYSILYARELGAFQDGANCASQLCGLVNVTAPTGRNQREAQNRWWSRKETQDLLLE